MLPKSAKPRIVILKADRVTTLNHDIGYRSVRPDIRPTGAIGHRSAGSGSDGGGSETRGASALSAAFVEVGAFGLANKSKDAALLVTLPPGSYTAQVSGVNNATGTALVEVYDVP